MRGRNATSTIWRTVVFAGAMLASPACKKSSNTASTTPETGETATPTEDPGTATPTDPNAEVGEDPCAGQGEDGEDPCAGRPRGVDEDEEGGVGRGFVLS